MRPARERSASIGSWAALAVGVVAAVLAWRQFELGQWLTLQQLKDSREALAAWAAGAPATAAAAFFAAYVAVAALSIPGAAVLTLAAGALFGLATGFVLVSFASSIGALLAFLVARHLLREPVRRRFGGALSRIDEGVRQDGGTYLLMLRLVPVFPFWLVNLLAGLTPLPAARFYLFSQLGMLPGTLAYVNAGTQLAQVSSPADVLSPGVLASLLLLAVLAPAVRWLVERWRLRRLHARWPRPRRFERNLVVIGAGSGGLVSAYIAAAVRAKVTLVERGRMGGDCLNTGCVPSKALIRTARLARQFRDAPAFGFARAEAEVDFARVMQRVHEVVRRVEPHDSVERYEALGVEVLRGHARLVSPWEVEVRGDDGSLRCLTTRSIVVAAGASPTVPPLPGLAEAGCLTSDTLWGLTALPRRLLVLGGGPVGCELAQAFALLGSQVTLVERGARVLAREDEEAAQLVAQALRADGVDVRTAHEGLRVESDGDGWRLVARHGDAEPGFSFDRVLCAVGRTPRVSGYGLEALGIPLTPRGTIQTNAWLQTRYPNIYAVGDVAGPLQLTHAASHQAWHAAMNALFGRFRRFRVDLSAVPQTTFTDPEVARVGLTEAEAREQGVAHEVTRYALDDLDRAIADGAERGFVKVLTVPGRDRILGVTIVGEHAGELLAEFVLAMRHGLGLGKILSTVHAYPTLAEANKAVAGRWRRDHAPQRLLRWAARFHDWERA